MLDFPASPTNGQLFTGANGVVYQWNAAGGLWLAYGVGMNNAIIASTPPANPTAGQLWWSQDLGQLFIYYTDPNTSQWVAAAPAPTYPPPPPNMGRVLGRVVPVAGQTSIDFTNIPPDINDLEVRFGVEPQTSNAYLYLQNYDGNGVLDVAAHYAFTSNYTYHSAPLGSNVTAYNEPTLTVVCLNLYTGTSGVSSTSSFGIQGVIKINNIRDAARGKLFDFTSVYLESTNSYWTTIKGSGLNFNPGALSGLHFYWSSGNFAAGGEITLLGNP